MRTIRRQQLSPRRVAHSAGETGVVMMFVLMAILLIGAITISVIQLISADVAGGQRQLQAEQVFNVAQAGVHYAIGKLQLSSAASYAGETITISSGSTTLGTATITVNCIDTGTAPPCATAYAGYRRIISAGALPVAGPSRTIVAVVQATNFKSPVCAYGAIQLSQGVTINGDVGSNSGVTTLSQSATVNGNVATDGSLNLNGSNGQPVLVTGTAKANGTITGASCPTPGCGPNVVEGGATSNAGLGTLCPSVTYSPGYFQPGSGPTNVTGGTSLVINSATGYTWGDITLSGGINCNQPTGIPTDLVIQAGAAGTTTVVQVNSLSMQQCSRVVIVGSGVVNLRIGTAGTAVSLQQSAKFGAAPTDTLLTPVMVTPGQLVVDVNSAASSAITLQQSTFFAATLRVPNGGVSGTQSGTFQGSVIANTISLSQTSTINGDPSALVYTAFSSLRSWKDQ
jgi:Tfp pilus assembly protein PilX